MNWLMICCMLFFSFFGVFFFCLIWVFLWMNVCFLLFFIMVWVWIFFLWLVCMEKGIYMRIIIYNDNNVLSFNKVFFL